MSSGLRSSLQDLAPLTRHLVGTLAVPAQLLPSLWWHRRNFTRRRRWAAGTWGIPANLPLRVP